MLFNCRYVVVNEISQLATVYTQRALDQNTTPCTGATVNPHVQRIAAEHSYSAVMSSMNRVAVPQKECFHDGSLKRLMRYA